MNVKALTKIWWVDPKETSLWCHPFEHGFCELKLLSPLSGVINMDHTFYKRKKLQLYTHCNDSKQQKQILALLLDNSSVYPCQRFSRVTVDSLNYHDHIFILVFFWDLYKFLTVPSIIFNICFSLLFQRQVKPLLMIIIMDSVSYVSCWSQS